MEKDIKNMVGDSVEYQPSVKPVEEPKIRGPEYNELRYRILARQPLIFIDTYDREWMYSLLAKLRNDQKVVERLGRRPGIYEHVAGLGRLDFDTKGIAPSAKDVHEFLFQGRYAENDILVLHGHPRMFENPELSGWLRAIVSNDMNDAAGVENEYGTVSKGHFLYVMVVGQNIQMPSDLIPYSVRMELLKPTQGAIEKVFDSMARLCERDSFVTSSAKHSLCESLRGFSRNEIELILRYAFQEEEIGQCGVQILKAKREMIKRTGFLKLIESEGDVECEGDHKSGADASFAGLEELQAYLGKVGKLARLAEEQQCSVGLLDGYGLKGILLVGMPGCGKSMAAKSARRFINPNWPLIQLDIGRLLGKYVGESEYNMRMALDIAERVSPCVLWIDELEKAFSGLDSSDGTALRLFGSFLTWMQEKRKPVYVIATANNIDRLPDEFKRKGRFDEIFRILLPNETERAKIFEFHLRRFRSADMLDGISDDATDDGRFASLCSDLAKTSSYKSDGRGFSGADIAAVVNAVAADALVNYGKVSRVAIEREIRRYLDSHLTQRDLMARAGGNGEDAYQKAEAMLKNSGFRSASKE